MSTQTEAGSPGDGGNHSGDTCQPSEPVRMERSDWFPEDCGPFSQGLREWLEF